EGPPSRAAAAGAGEKGRAKAQRPGEGRRRPGALALLDRPEPIQSPAENGRPPPEENLLEPQDRSLKQVKEHGDIPDNGGLAYVGASRRSVTSTRCVSRRASWPSAVNR